MTGSCDSSEVTTTGLADCQTKFFRRFKQLGNLFKQITERSRDRMVLEFTRPLTDCQTTFFGCFSNQEKCCKKSSERSRDRGGGTATVGRLSNNVFGTFHNWEILWKKVTERSRRQLSEIRDRRSTVPVGCHFPQSQESCYQTCTNVVSGVVIVSEGD